MSRVVAGLVLALLLGACAQTTIQNTPVTGTSGMARPATIVVSSFAFSSDTVLLDRGFAAQLRRKMGRLSPEQLREQLAARVSREIASAALTAFRDAGFEARHGGEEAVAPERPALLVTGNVRTVDQGNRTRRNLIGFGAGKSQVVADVVVTHFTQGTKREALSFVVEAESGRRPGAIATGPAGAARGAAVAAASAGAGMASDKLSADVEAEARRIGRAAARRVLDFATEQGWPAKPGA